MKVIVTKKRERIIVDDDVHAKIGNLKWYLNEMFGGKMVARRNKIPNSDCTYLHHYVLGRKPKIEEGAFFRNGNTLDYRRRNLEFRTNTREKKGRYIGVRPVLAYEARVWNNGKRVRIGVFNTELKAVMARNKYCKKHKLNVRLNDI